MDYSTNCDNKIRVSKTIEEGSLIYAEVQPEIKLRFCMYEAAYTVSALKKSNVYDDVVFITKNSRLLKSIYPLNEGTCRSIWQNKNFTLPGFGDKTFKVNNLVTEKILQRASETTYAEEHSQSFMKKNNCEGAMYAEPVEWVSPTGVKLIGNVMINAKLYIGTIWGKLIQRNLLSFKDPLGFSKTVFIKTTYFEDNLVNYFFENRGEQTCQTIKHFNKEDPVKIFGNNKTTFISGKILHKNKYEDFALEILEEKAISLCGQQVKTTGVPGVFYSDESSELKTGNLKITMEMFLSRVVETLNFELLKEREFFL